MWRDTRHQRHRHQWCSGYNRRRLELFLVSTINGSGSGAVVELTVGALGAITSFSVTSGGSNYQAGDVWVEAENGGGTDLSLR